MTVSPILSHLKRNLEEQVVIDQRAADAPRALKVITNFSAEDEARAARILTELKLTASAEIIVVDALGATTSRPRRRPESS